MVQFPHSPLQSSRMCSAAYLSEEDMREHFPRALPAPLKSGSLCMFMQIQIDDPSGEEESNS